MVRQDKQKYIKDLAQRPFFQVFDSQDIKQIKDQSILRNYNKNQVVSYEGDHKHYYYFVLQGLIKLERTTYNGNYSYVDFVIENRFVAYGDLFNNDYYSYNIIAETPTRLLMIPTDLFESIISQNSDLLVEFYRSLSDDLFFQEKRIQLAAVSSAKERVELMLALWMLDLGTRQGEAVLIPYPLTIIQLSEVAGTTRETAGKVVKELTQDKRLEYSRKEIKILDTDYFNHLLEG